MKSTPLNATFQKSTPEDAELSALALRIADAIAAAETQTSDAQPRAIVFRVGPIRLALPLLSIREVVVAPVQLSRVPRASEGVLGIMNLRGRVVAIVDLAHVLPAAIGAQLISESMPDPRTARVLLLERGRHEIGLLIDDLEGIAPLSTGRAEEPLLLDPASVTQAIDALVT